MLIGLAASVQTPYTRSGLDYARQLGCRTVFIFCNATPDPSPKADILISLPVGPEVITGSTRMKAGTAQKLTLNMISTTGMILLGKTYGNLMVDLQARSEKLAARSRMPKSCSTGLMDRSRLPSSCTSTLATSLWRRGSWLTPEDLSSIVNRAEHSHHELLSCRSY